MALTPVNAAGNTPSRECVISCDAPDGMANIHVRSTYERLANKSQQYDVRLMSISCKDYSYDASDTNCQPAYLPLALEIGRVLVNGVRERSYQADIRAQPG